MTRHGFAITWPRNHTIRVLTKETLRPMKNYNAF